MAAINFPTATSNGQTFTADTGVIYTYVGTPPNGFWSGTFATQGLTTLDGRYIAQNDGNTRQTIQTQGLQFNNGTSDTILIDAVNSKIGIGTTSPDTALDISSSDNTYVTVQSTANDKNALTFYKTGQAASSGFYVGLNASEEAMVWQTENNTIRFGTNNTERLRIDSAGQIGCGTTNPQAQFVISNSGAQGIEAGYSAGTSTNFIQAYNRSSSAFIQLDVIGNPLVFKTGSGATERMKIDSSGNIGIGGAATATASTKTLQLTDSTTARMLLESTGTGGRKYGWYTSVDGQFAVYDYTANSERLRIDSSGNVGIGITNPGGKLHVESSATTAGWQIRTDSVGLSNESGFYRDASDNYELVIRNGAGGLSFLKNDGGASTANLSFNVQGTEKMRIDSSGRVGIGDDSPDALLVIKGNSDAATTPSIRLKDGTDTREAWITNSAGDLSLNVGGNDNVAHGTFKIFDSGIFDYAQGASSRLRIDSSGNVGIGTTSPSGKLNIEGSDSQLLNLVQTSGDLVIRLNDAGAGSAYIKVRDNTGGSLSFDTGGSERMRIDSSGNLGLGQTSLSATGFNKVLRVKPASGAAGIFVESSDSAHYLGLFGGTSASDSAAVLYPGAGSLRFGTTSGIGTPGWSEKIRFTSAGRVGINETDPDYRLHIKETTTANNYAFVENTTAGNAGVRIKNSSADYLLLASSSSLRFYNNGTSTESARIDSSGNVLVGKTASNFANAGVEIRPSGEIALTRGGDLLTTRRVSTEGTHLSFRNINGSIVGNIVTTSSATAYNTSSDYRLKENVELLTGAIPRVKLLPVKRFNFIGNDQTVDGFMAHEAAVVVPESVTGTHNEVDGDGNPVYQSIDQAKLVPLLTAALQEAISRIETLETEVAVLKAA